MRQMGYGTAMGVFIACFTWSVWPRLPAFGPILEALIPAVFAIFFTITLWCQLTRLAGQKLCSELLAAAVVVAAAGTFAWRSLESR
jgi:hypothetical protein